MIWTASGPVYTVEEVKYQLENLEDGVKDFLRKPDLQALRNALGDTVHDELKRCYEKALPQGLNVPIAAGGRMAPHAFHTDFLFGGFANDKAYLLEISGDLQMNWHTDAQFFAIGSGGDFASVAQALMEHLVDEDLTLGQGQMVAWRTIETTCRVSSQLVRTPVQMAIVDAEGARVLTRDEVEDIGDTVQSWIESEKAALREFGQPPPAEELSDLVPDLGARAKESDTAS